MKSLFAAVAAAVVLGAGVIGATVLAETWDQWRYAVSYHKADQVLDMLARGQDIDMQDDLGWTARSTSRPRTGMQIWSSCCSITARAPI